jgi:hypothetical protein
MKQKLLLIFLFSTLSLQLPADECDLFHDLELVEAINRRMAETVPVTYNQYAIGTYGERRGNGTWIFLCLTLP